MDDDPLPAYIFASWLVFLIPAAYLCVHGADTIAAVLNWLAFAIDRPLPPTGEKFVVTVSAVLVVFCAVLYSGYLLFTFVPPAEGSPVLTLFGALIACAVSMLVFPFSAWVWGGVWETRMVAGVFPLLGWMLYTICVLRTEAALKRPYVLFFRRFDSFADLSILPALLRLTPRRTPVAMLVSGDENEIGYWDPVRLMAYGLHANLPWGGRPVFLRGGEHWERAMQSLLDRSSVVVFDQTEKSEAMTKEARAVAAAGLPLILLAENATERADNASGPVEEIPYQRDRYALALRIAAVVAIVGFAAWLVELPQQISDKAAQGELIGGLFGAAVMLFFYSAIAGGLLLRKGLSPDARRRTARALRTFLREADAR